MRIFARRVDHVQVCIPPGAEEKARRFYEEVLGFHAIEKPAGLKLRPTMWFQNGDVEFHVAVDAVTERTRQHPAVIVEEIERVRAHLVERGVALQEEPEILDRKRFSFLDPFGNKIEFLEYHKDRKVGN